jgi:Family of unknown function (DUF6159)
MFERIRRSWELVRAASAVLRDDPRLLILPLLSAVCAALVFATFVVPIALSGAGSSAGSGNTSEAWLYAWMLLLYTALYSVGIFFNTALVGVALVRLGGGDATIRAGLALAAARLWRIVGYALIAATVGMLLRALEDRIGWIGRLVMRSLGVAWSAASFLVVPILATRDLTPVEAVAESTRLLKQTWGENITGALGIGAVFVLGYILLMLAGFGGAALLVGVGQQVVAVVWVGLCVVCGVVALLWQSALQSVYAAALYRYATEGVTGFGGDLLEHAFKPRR